MSRKHLHRYINESCGRHDMRCADTIDQMKMLVWGMENKRLKYTDLTETHLARLRVLTTPY